MSEKGGIKLLEERLLVKQEYVFSKVCKLTLTGLERPDSFKAGPQSRRALLVPGWHLTWPHLAPSQSLTDMYCEDDPYPKDVYFIDE